MTMERANPFDGLDDFTTKPVARPVEPALIERLARDNGFPSRQAAPVPAVATATPEPRPLPATTPLAGRPAPRRHKTGRNQQLNLKATPDTVALFYRLAEERGVSLGVLLEQALSALDKSTKPQLPA